MLGNIIIDTWQYGRGCSRARPGPGPGPDKLQVRQAGRREEVGGLISALTLGGNILRRSGHGQCYQGKCGGQFWGEISVLRVSG